MLESIVAALHLLAEVFGVVLRPLAELLALVATPGADALTTATAVAAALAVLALLAVAVTLLATPAFATAGTPHPRRAIADATRLTESHPDAPGHSRPRAPGSAALAA